MDKTLFRDLQQSLREAAAIRAAQSARQQTEKPASDQPAGASSTQTPAQPTARTR